jgi:hypothetical protein
MYIWKSSHYLQYPLHTQECFRLIYQGSKKLFLLPLLLPTPPPSFSSDDFFTFLPVLRIRTFLVRSGSGRLGQDPDPGLNKCSYNNIFGVCENYKKKIRNLCCLTFWFRKKNFWAYFCQKNFYKKLSWKYLMVRFRIRKVSSRIQIRIRSKIVRISNTAF